jgi:hypothetical protein
VTVMRRDPPPIIIPVDSAFRDLGLWYDAVTGTISFNRPALISFIGANQLDVVAILTDDEKQLALIGDWYRAHIEAGGALDPVMELVEGHVG